MTKEKKNVIWNILGATFNSFNSLFFTVIVTRINGLNDAGIYTYSFATACLLYIIGIYEGRAFQVTDITGKNTDTDYIYNRIITCIIMMVASISFVLIKGYDRYKITIFLLLCMFRCIEAFAESIYGIIQKNGNLYQVGISLFIKAVIGVLCFSIIDNITKNLILSILSVIFVNIIFILLYDFKNLKQIKISKSKFSIKNNNRIFKTGFYTFILTFLGIYLINAPRYAIDDLSTNDLQTIFGIIIMPATFMALLVQYIIQPALTSIADYIKNEQYINLKKTIQKLILIITILGIIVFIIAYALEVPVLQLIYGIELKPYFIGMMIIIFGALFYAMSSMLSTILIAMRSTLLQAISYGATSIISTGLAYYMVKKYAILGASLTYTFTMIIITIILSILIFIKMKQYKVIFQGKDLLKNSGNNKI